MNFAPRTLSLSSYLPARTAMIPIFVSLFLIVVLSHGAFAQATAPSLGTAQSFAVLGGSTVTNTGPTIVTGNLGVSPGTAVTGFPPGIVVGGVIHAGDAVAGQAQSDTGAAYGDLAGEACNNDLTGTDLGGLTLTPGVYCFSSSAQLTGTLTLNAEGDAGAVWVFQIGSTLTTASNASVLIINGGQQCNVFWQVGSSATLGTDTAFTGDILALASITLTTDTHVSGRALAQNGAVTMDSNTVSMTACAAPPVNPIPPTLSKSFDSATIAAGGVSILTITASNADKSVATLSSPLVDTLPSGVTVSGSASTTCTGGAVSASTGGSTVTLTQGSIPADGSCTVTVPVTAPDGGNYVNSLIAGSLDTNNGSNAAPAVATLTVAGPAVPPTLGKAFMPAVINAGGVTTLSITLSNADTKPATLTTPLVDTMPNDVTVSGTGSTTCADGTVTATTGDSAVTLTGGMIPARGSCTVTVPVTAPIAGSYINSMAAGVLDTSNGSNAGPAIATLIVNAPVGAAPTLGKAFGPAIISAGGVSTLTITLSNSDTGSAGLTAPLRDTLPSGVTVAGGGRDTCGGTLAAPTGSSAVTLTGGSIPAKGSCTVTVSVTAAMAGNFVNTLPAGALQTGNGNNASPTIASLTVSAAVIPPTLGKAFSPATITAGGLSTLAITLSNANATAATLTEPLVDTFPSGVTVSSGGTNTCGGKLTAAKGSSSVGLTGGSIPAKGSCTVTVVVTAPTAGAYFNSLPAGALKTSHGSNASPTIASLAVSPTAHIVPTLSKVFSPGTITAGGVSTLTITLSNANATAASILAPLVDSLPAYMTVSGNGSTSCGGTLTASKGSSSVTLQGGSIPAKGSCKLTVPVTASKQASCFNVLLPGALKTSNGSNTVAATATLTVKAPILTTPTLSKGYSPNTIKPGGTSLLTIVLRNATGTVDKITAPFTDTFPSGELASSSATNTCNGVSTAHSGGSTVTLTGGSIPAKGSCMILVHVTVKADGSYHNRLTACSLHTSKGCNLYQAVGVLTVGVRLSKSFSPNVMAAGGISHLTIELFNPTSTAASLTTLFTDQFPSGLHVSGAASTTCGGIVRAANGGSSVTLVGGAIPAGGSCRVTVNVTATTPDCYFNTLPTGALHTSRGSNTDPYTASLMVY